MFAVVCSPILFALIPPFLGVEKLRVLLLEDSAADAELAGRELKKHGLVEMRWVASEESYLKQLREFEPLVILSDHSVGQFTSLDALRRARELRPTAVFIVFSGHIDEERTVTAIRHGADDVLAKEHISRLRMVIRRALGERWRLSTLTPRQLEVLRLVVNGRTTPAIAQQLGLSVKTVETHRAEIMRRLGIRDLVGLVRFGIRLGLGSG
jgi:DNA-binding NarL/FixJ family response regulator